MTRIAIGRKNWLFTGSLRTGIRNASMMSLVASALRMELDVSMYLESVITHRLRGTAKLEELLPDRWRANHPEGGREYREQERRDALRYRALKFLEPGHQNLKFPFCFPVLLVIFDHSFTFNTPLGSIRTYRTERAWHRFGPIGAVPRFQVALNKPILNRVSRNSFKVNRVWSPWYLSRWVQSRSYRKETTLFPYC